MLNTIKALCQLYGLPDTESRKAVDMGFNDGLIDKIERQACQRTLLMLGE